MAMTILLVASIYLAAAAGIILLGIIGGQGYLVHEHSLRSRVDVDTTSVMYGTETEGDTTTTRAATQQTTTVSGTKPYPGYTEITYKLLRDIEDIALGYPIDCRNIAILCDMKQIVKGQFDSSLVDCTTSSKQYRSCKYQEIYIDSQSDNPKINRNAEYSKLPYGSRYVLIPEDCDKTAVLREMCRLRGHNVGPPADPDVLPTTRVKIVPILGLDIHPLTDNTLFHHLRHPAYKAVYKHYFYKVYNTTIPKHDFNLICCYTLNLADCYIDDDETRMCYFKRLLQIAYKDVISYNGTTVSGDPDPQIPFNKYWDKGFNQRSKYFTDERLLLKRDCIERQSSKVGVYCPDARFQLHCEYFTAADIADLNSVIT